MKASAKQESNAARASGENAGSGYVIKVEPLWGCIPLSKWVFQTPSMGYPHLHMGFYGLYKLHIYIIIYIHMNTNLLSSRMRIQVEIGI
jgi:hypothetical protein